MRERLFLCGMLLEQYPLTLALNEHAQAITRQLVWQ